MQGIPTALTIPGPASTARRPLCIAVVTETYPPEVNGVALSLARVVEGLHARGHRVQLIRPRRGNDDSARNEPGFAEFLLRGLPIPRYPELRMGVPSRGALVRAWRRTRPDLVHIATEGPLGWSALRAARELGLPVSSEFRTNFHAYCHHYGIGWLRRAVVAYLRWFHNRADCTMVPTEALRGELGGLGFERTLVVARGVDAGRFDPVLRSSELRAGWGATAEDLVVMYVGRLAAEKNLETLLAAFAAMKQGRGLFAPRLRLVLVGDGPQRTELEKRCPGAVFAGQRTGADLARHYASGDLFVFPSLSETYGNVTPEAMGSGLPVLAYAQAAAAQLIEPGRNGMLVPPGDRAGFVQAAVRLVADVARLRGMGVEARRTALALDWGRIVAQVEGVMYEACARNAALVDQGRWTASVGEPEMPVPLAASGLGQGIAAE